jgi:tetratricopeptide (TPR) repeat protein
LTPENPVLQVNLGQAYLNLGQDDKALAAFDRAVDLSATPVVWNDIAYDLTLKNSHLDRAQQYAESAVAATVAASRNVALEQLNQRDLATTSSLAAYWDTLGWVYFAKNDLPKAEKYLTAAWALDQHSDLGDHLGQLYEKQGRREDAIRLYAMALAALRPEPEARTRLARLVGDAKVDSTVNQYREDLVAMRTIKLGKVAKQTGNADFFLLLANEGGSAKVLGVKFVSGEDKLKIFTEALRSAKYKQPFPDDSPTQIVRRGVLSCSQTTGECGFVLLLPSDVNSVN